MTCISARRHGNLDQISRTENSNTENINLWLKGTFLKVPEYCHPEKETSRLVSWFSKNYWFKSEWFKLPRFGHDDRRYELWLGIINNCRGLMSVIGSHVTLPARAISTCIGYLHSILFVQTNSCNMVQLNKHQKGTRRYKDKNLWKSTTLTRLRHLQSQT